MAGYPPSAGLADRGVTRREAEVLAALGDRLSNAEIAGRLYLSERTVESHVTSLLRKIGARNRVELGDLARQLLSRDLGRPSPLPAALALLVETTPFVGRAAEVTRLRDLWERAAAGRLLVGVVAGEAGMGKSRIVAELAAEVHKGGAQVMLGACFEDMQTPFQPFAQAISADVADLTDAELQRRVGPARGRLAWLVPELGGAVTPAVDQAEDAAAVQAEMFGSLHGYLGRAADAAPLLLVVEDVHWATSTTLGALRHIARLSGHAAVLVVITTRAHAPDMHADLALFLADLGRLASVARVDLAGLDEDEVAAMLGSLGADADPAAVRTDTGGNPLFVREVASASHGRSGSLMALLARRYALLDHHALDVLDLGAVLGPTFDADVLATAARYPLPVVLESLERAEAAGVVARAADQPGRFAFVHALFRAARYDALPESRRMELHRQIAGALRERADDERVLPEFARHASMAASPDDGGGVLDDLVGTAGLAERARRALREEGDRAMALNDFAAAGHAYEGALRLWPAQDPERPSLLLAFGRAIFTTERRGGDVLTKALDGLVGAGDLEGAAEAEMMLGELDWIGSRWDGASAHFDRAAALVDDRPPSSRAAHVFADLTRFRMISGDNRAARGHGERALAMARELGLAAVEASVLITTGPARVVDGDVAGIADAQAGVELAETLDSPEMARGYANMAYVYAILGDINRSAEWRRRASEAAERFGLTEMQRWVAAHDTEYKFQIGQWDRGLAGAEAFITEAEPSGHYLVTVCLRVRARVRLGRGNAIGALADAAAAVEFARGSRHPSNLLVALPFHARCLYESGRTGEADLVMSEAIAAAAGTEIHLEPIELAIVAAGLGREVEYLEVVSLIAAPSKRRDMGRVIGEGDLDRAAGMLAEEGYRSAEGYVRMVAAERLAEQGRMGEAEAQVRRALAFHRSVGATAYVQRGERLVAALR